MEDWLSSRARARPDDRAVLWSRDMHVVGVTYSDLNDRVADFCARLSAAGIKEGDRVGVILPNYVGYVIVIYALIRLDAILVPINTRLTTDEIEYQLEKTDCHAIVYTWFTEEIVTPLANRHAYKLLNIKITTDNYLRIVNHKQTIEADMVKSYIKGTISLERPFVIIFTSGTTGKPKGAVLSYGNVFYSAMASAYRIGTLPDDIWLSILPMYHIGGLSIIIRAVLYGIAVDLRAKFNAERFNIDLWRGRVSLISLVPTMLHRLIEARRDRVWSKRLRLILLGGAPASPDLMQQCRDLDIPVAMTYGLSEAASQVATTMPGDALIKPGSVGKPVMFTSVRVVDEHGNDTEPFEYGEVVVRGPTVMMEYYNEPEATAEMIRDGELWTGDIGYFDNQNDLWLVQRRSDLIVTGGENVYPAEVESILLRHPAVDEVAVVGLPDLEWGQRVAAAIVLEPNRHATEDDIINYSRQHLAGYKLPRHIKFIDELPHTATGKIQRPHVAELFRDV